ncbi:hypothetical protein ACFP47_11475 [Nesterenkonia lacusekhoensis]|uniref:Uncharacterized protein n=1 Tax=Nesterenkonia lacusekhoensis TaxID=150832 RepID=A0ABS4T504_9MICC|nr:hypothetical protein [Nesterenkonia lacusekhoensis]MBP2319498.1 hypothetical protein [Nesterenkonia lacusekhoensis]
MKNTKTITGLSLAALLALTACGDDNGNEETEAQEPENQAEENGTEEESEEESSEEDAEAVEAEIREVVEPFLDEQDQIELNQVEEEIGSAVSFYAATGRAHVSLRTAEGMNNMSRGLQLGQEVYNLIIDEVEAIEELNVHVQTAQSESTINEYAEVEESTSLDDVLEGEIQPIIDEEVGEGEPQFDGEEEITVFMQRFEDPEHLEEVGPEIAEIVFRELQGRELEISTGEFDDESGETIMEPLDVDSLEVALQSNGPEKFFITSDGTMTEMYGANEEGTEDLGWDYSGEGDGDTDDEDSEEDDDFFEN